jgi:hypothetical protein
MSVPDETRGPIYVSEEEFEEWVNREVGRDPYGRVSAEVIMYGRPRLFKGRQYIIARPDSR